MRTYHYKGFAIARIEKSEGHAVNPWHIFKQAGHEACDAASTLRGAKFLIDSWSESIIQERRAS